VEYDAVSIGVQLTAF